MGEMVAGRWELREPIASGGTSTVWRATDHKLGTACAAKLLRQRDAGQILRFAREQSRRLVGSHVVAPYAWAADDGTAIIVFELVTGGSLRTLIGDYGGLSDGTVVTILDQLLDALTDVHRAGIVHRDVKPANVLLQATGEGPLDVALTDFGIAIAESESRLTQAGMVIGTPGYVPPEVLSGNEPPLPAHDLYALGRLAVALILGHEDGTAQQALEEIQDAHLRLAIATMIQHDPSARPSDAAQVQLLLTDAHRDAVPHDRDGDPIAVFEHVFDTAGEQAAPADLDKPILEPDTSQPGKTLATVASTGLAPNMSVSKRVAIGIALTASIGLGAVVWTNLGGDSDPGPTPPTVSPSAQSSPGQVPTAAQEGRERGDACTWQSEGDFATTTDDTRLKCQLINGEYVWELE